MKRLLKSSSVLLLSGLWFLAATPARSQPLGVLKSTCDAMVNLLNEHHWKTEYPEPVPFPFTLITVFQRDGMAVRALRIGQANVRVQIDLPRQMVEADWKALYQKLGLPESAPEPKCSEILGAETTLIQADGVNWVMVTVSFQGVTLDIGSKNFYETGEDFQKGKVKPAVLKEKTGELLKELLPE